MKSYVKQELLPGGIQKGKAAHDFDFVCKYNKETQKIFKKYASFSYEL